MKDFPLSPNFSFWELTHTDRKELQEQNRSEALAFQPSLTAVAQVLEMLQKTTGIIEVHSGFRCPDLNGMTKGSSKKSQHMIGEAVDFSGPGEETDDSVQQLFQKVLTVLISEAFPFGQLIREEAMRGYGVARWLHLSLGQPFREAARCGEVLTMKNGKYNLVKTVPIGR